MDDEIVRRDRRTEWIRRNRLHPRHGELSQPSTARYGPTGIQRKNPRERYFIGPNGLKRCDADASRASLGASASRSPAKNTGPSRQRVKVIAPMRYIVAVADMSDGKPSSHDRDMLGLAHGLKPPDSDDVAVVAVCFASPDLAAFAEAGADRIIVLDKAAEKSYSPETDVDALVGVNAQFSPLYWLFPDTAEQGGELGRRLAARLGERPAAGVWKVEGDTCVSRSGNQMRDTHRPLARIMLVATECADPIDETEHDAQALAYVSDLNPDQRKIEDLGLLAIDPSEVALQEAEFIMAAGNGVRDWQLFHHASTVLGAAEGASRMVVDDGHMPRERQVGATGVYVNARVYLALGISGAVQHLQGIEQCEKVIAVNTDANCDMVKRADLSLICDVNEFLVALLALIEGAPKQSNRHAA